jgi:hypothetical protein
MEFFDKRQHSFSMESIVYSAHASEGAGNTPTEVGTTNERK